jgi:sigma-B regulation protein RsbU (phosphoserine phosphatase)
MRIIDAQRIAAVVLADRTPPETAHDGSLVEVVDRDISIAELRGRFVMIDRYYGHFKRMENELRNMERLGKRLDEHFRELDQEMQLAGRLQRDFLPQLDEPICNVQFATLYRPASWVSGDTFDVFRIDERYTGFYVADAVGHGMAASLLTMFIRRAIVPKHVGRDGYTVLGPSETMATLNDALADQSLPNCQFVTACYALLDHQTLNLRYARGGHPYPILITDEGIVSELKVSGGLLGVSKGQEFATFEIQLRPGDKLLLYTDGVELAFQSGDGNTPDTSAYQRVFEKLAPLPLKQMLAQIDAELDKSKGSLKPSDDITITGLEVLCPSGERA